MSNKLIILALVLAASSCTNVTVHDTDMSLAHVVLVWLKNPGSEQDRQRIIDASKQLANIDGVVRVKAGQTIPSDRDVVDDSFDVGLYVELESTQALSNYAVDPLHIKVLREEIAPVTDHYVVYDFEVDR